MSRNDAFVEKAEAMLTRWCGTDGYARLKAVTGGAATGAEIGALERRGRAEIERQSAEVQTRLLAGGLQTEEAKAFLQSIPAAADLMPLLYVDAIEAIALARRP